MKKKVGRPSGFTPTVAQKIIEKYAEGYTEKEVADFIETTEQTIRNWKREHEEFFWASKEAKAIPDAMAEAAFFKRVIGMSYTEEVMTKDGVQRIKRYVPPDVNAFKYWSKNRMKARWKDRVEIEHSVSEEEEIVAPDGTTVIDKA